MSIVYGDTNAKWQPCNVRMDHKLGVVLQVIDFYLWFDWFFCISRTALFPKFWVCRLNISWAAQRSWEYFKWYIENDECKVQGSFLKRHIIKKKDSQPYGATDIKVGQDVEFYGKIIHIVDADPYTRKYLTELGVNLADAEPFPLDPIETKKLAESLKKGDALFFLSGTNLNLFAWVNTIKWTSVNRHWDDQIPHMHARRHFLGLSCVFWFVSSDSSITITILSRHYDCITSPNLSLYSLKSYWQANSNFPL